MYRKFNCSKYLAAILYADYEINKSVHFVLCKYYINYEYIKYNQIRA